MMWLYRALLYLYPASFRTEYGAEMRSVLRTELARANGTWQRILAWLAACGEIPIYAAAAHRDILAQDLRYTFRSLSRTPGFALTSVLLVALGVGANTAAFTVTDYALLRPLPYPRADRLVKIWESPPGYSRVEASPLNYRDWKTSAKSFAGMGAFTNLSANLVGLGEPVRVVGASVGPEVLSLLGVEPFAGRLFSADTSGGAPPPEVILSYDLWQAQFGADDKALGRRVLLDGAPFIVIGIMPRTFQFPNRDAKLWTPLELNPGAFRDRNDTFLQVVARLRTGVTFRQASTEMHAVARTLEAEYPRENAKVDVSVWALRDEVSGQSKTLLITLSAAAACILLLACANLANLLIVRAIGRERELSVRTALGAGRERLVRQMITESAILAAAGGGAGIAVAFATVPLLAQLVPQSIPIAAIPAIDGRALAFAAAVTAFTGIAFGLIPALRAGGKNALRGLRGGTRAGSGRSESARAFFVVVEVMASVVLLVSSGLLVRAMQRLNAVDPGFRANGVLTARTALPLPKYSAVSARDQFYARVLSDVRALPGVTHAAYVSFLPMVMTGGIWPVVVEGEPPAHDGAHSASLRFATPDYFPTMGIPIVRGRDFEPRDAQQAPFVAVVSASFAKRYWPDQDAIGKRFSIGLSERTVVGVAGDVRVRGLDRTSEPQAYVPQAQVADGNITFYIPKDLVVRTTGDPRTLVSAVQRIVRSVDPEQPVSNVQTMNDIIAAQTATRGVEARVLGVLAALAFIIAGVGIHGLLSFSVSQRAREFAVRLALGARTSEIVAMVMRRAAVLALVGVVPGLALAYAGGLAMQSVLAGVAPGDVPTFAAAAVACLAMAALGCLLPVLKAMRVDPLGAIRAE